MDYRILRQEESTDSDDNPEVFMSVEITNEGELFARAEWLSPEDVVRLQADASVADSIAEQIAQRAVLARQTAPAPVPQPSFSVTLFYQRMGQVFTIPQQIAFGQMAPNFIAALQMFDFANIKQIMDYIVSQNSDLQPLANTLKGLFLEQGIDLDTF